MVLDAVGRQRSGRTAWARTGSAVVPASIGLWGDLSTTTINSPHIKFVTNLTKGSASGYLDPHSVLRLYVRNS